MCRGKRCTQKTDVICAIYWKRVKSSYVPLKKKSDSADSGFNLFDVNWEKADTLESTFRTWRCRYKQTQKKG